MRGPDRPSERAAAGGSRWPREIGSAVDRLAAIAAMALVVSWAITHRYGVGDWLSTVLLFAAIAVLALVLVGRHAGGAALLVATTAGLMERLWRTPVLQSDVTPYLREAAVTLLAGQDPYTHLNLSTVPVASFGFAYPPGALIVYLPFLSLTTDLRTVERVTSLLVVLLLASLAWRVGSARAALGVALFGVFELAGFRALDGSNDSTLTFLLLAAVALLLYSSQRSGLGRSAFWASAVPLTLAILFKQLAWPIAFFLLYFLWREHPQGRRYGVVTVGAAVLITLPFVIWDPAAFVRGLFFEPFNHTDIWGASVWTVIEDLRPGLVRALGPIATVISLAGMLATALYFVVRRPPRDLPEALGAGLATFAVALALARWTTSPYFIFGFAMCCALVIIWPLTADPEAVGDRS